MTKHETESGNPSAAAGSIRGAAAARAVAACGWCGSAGVAGYALHEPALAVSLAAAGAAAVTVVIVLLTAVICREDERSPFERLMLIACLLAGRRPADYLPPPERLRPITGVISATHTSTGRRRRP